MPVTKLSPAPLTYPNGGGLASMNKKAPKSQQLELDALKAKHEVELQKLKEKHASANSSKPVKEKKNG
jgi:hypothetical protein